MAAKTFRNGRDINLGTVPREDDLRAKGLRFMMLFV
jgi:hypothetical protein